MEVKISSPLNIEWLPTLHSGRNANMFTWLSLNEDVKPCLQVHENCFNRLDFFFFSSRNILLATVSDNMLGKIPEE